MRYHEEIPQAYCQSNATYPMKPPTSKIRADKCNTPLTPQQRAWLSGNPHRKKPLGDFVDKSRTISEDYYEFLEDQELQEITIESQMDRLHGMISKDPDFLDPYLYLAELYYETDNESAYINTISSAYQKALHLVGNKNGEYPLELSWGWTENRHIIRALNNFALLRWEQGDVRLAIEVYRKLLASNPHDNIGARFSILALRLGYNPDYEALFIPDTEPIYGLDAGKVNAWFDQHSVKFPEEFQVLTAPTMNHEE